MPHGPTSMFEANLKITWRESIFKYPWVDYMHGYGTVLLNRIHSTAKHGPIAGKGEWHVDTGRSRDGFRVDLFTNGRVDLRNIAQDPRSGFRYAPVVEDRYQSVADRREIDETYLHRRVRDNLNRRRRRAEGKRREINARG